MLNLKQRTNNSVQIPDEQDAAFFLNDDGDLVLKEQDGTIKYVTISETKPPKVYKALLTQTGTDAPVATVLENTLGDIVWTRSSIGVYEGTLVNGFSGNIVFSLDASKLLYLYSEEGIRVFLERSSNSLITLTSSSAVGEDGWISNLSIKIEVYN